MRRAAPLCALYVADAISLAGNAVAQLAIPWFVLTTTGSATLTALAVFFNFLPIVLATFFGGVIVDRLGFRTNSSVVADLASAAAVAAIPLLHSTVGLELWQLMALVFLGALLDAPGATARAALLPDLVELAAIRMERASGMRSAIQQGSLLLGAPIGGVLVATVVPTQLRGRVFGAVRAGAWAAIPLGILLGGVLVAAIGIAATFLTIGMAYAAVVGYGFFNPAFREMDYRS